MEITSLIELYFNYQLLLINHTYSVQTVRIPPALFFMVAPFKHKTTVTHIFELCVATAVKRLPW